MLVKTFQASEMSEALRMVKAEMGLDAMILSTKKEKKKGVMGLFAKPYFEVTAAVEPRQAARPNPYREQPVEEPQRELSTKEEFQNSMLVPLAREVKELRARIEALSKKEEPPPQPPAPVAAVKVASAPEPVPAQRPIAKDELEELKKLLLNAVAEKEKLVAKPVVFPPANAAGKEEGDSTPFQSELAAKRQQAQIASEIQAQIAAERAKLQAELEAELEAARRGMQAAEELAARQAELLVQKNSELTEELERAREARSAAEEVAREKALAAEEQARLALEASQKAEEQTRLAREMAEVAKAQALAAQEQKQAAEVETLAAREERQAAEVETQAAREERQAAEMQAQAARAERQAAAEQAQLAQERVQLAQELLAQQEAQKAELEAELGAAREAAAAAREEVEKLAARHTELQAQQEAELTAHLSVARQAVQQAELLSEQLKAQQTEMFAAQKARQAVRGTGGHPLLEKLAELLLAEEMAESSVGALMREIHPAAEKGATLEELTALLIEAFGNVVKCAGSLRLEKNCARVMAMVGPTGVGKTTTIAKLAAMHALSRGAKVALITTDNFRVGAIEQLKTYAKIMDLPLEVVVTSQELGRAIDKHADKDLILIDTAGRSHKDVERLEELKGYLEGHTGVEIYLCVAATTRGKEIDEIVAKFGVLPIAKLLFTKVDESATFGSIVNANLRHKLPLSYFTTGQKVPEDIEVATPKKLAQLIMKESAQC